MNKFNSRSSWFETKSLFLKGFVSKNRERDNFASPSFLWKIGLMYNLVECSLFNWLRLWRNPHLLSAWDFPVIQPYSRFLRILQSISSSDNVTSKRGLNPDHAIRVVVKTTSLPSRPRWRLPPKMKPVHLQNESEMCIELGGYSLLCLQKIEAKRSFANLFLCFVVVKRNIW